MSVVPMDDINCLAQESSGKLNLILSGMLALMNDTDAKVSMMESQNWFQRMIKTVSGKNKMTQSEIEQNYDKLNAYMSEAIAELYNRNCIDHNVIISLGMQINELFADHLQLKQMLGAFVNKLNEKINSVDNFHMLSTEINQGVYGSDNAIASICKVTAQFDERILSDDRKLEIIERGLIEQGILSDDEVLLTDYLMSVAEISVEDIGEIYLELSTIRRNFFANILLKMIESYHFLSNMARKMKNKKVLVADLLEEEGLDGTVSLSTNEIYADFVASKISAKDELVPVPDMQSDSRLLETEQGQETEELQKAEQLYFDCKFDEAFEIFKSLAENGNARAMYFLGEIFYHQYGHIIKNDEEAKKWRISGYEAGDPLAALNALSYLPENSEELEKILNNNLNIAIEFAENGDIYAQFEVGFACLTGGCTECDKQKGLECLQKSAEAGFWGAMNTLGDAYSSGNYTKQDYAKAMYWYTKGIEKGNAHSYLNMAYVYYFGNGVDQNFEEARALALEAYKLGCGNAAYLLYLIFSYGLGVKADDEQAFFWAKEATEYGCENAFSELGDCYYFGKGTNQSIELARKYYTLASDAGDSDGFVMLGIMAIDASDFNAAKNWFRAGKEAGCCVEDAIETLCNTFYMTHDKYHYQVSNALKAGLGIGDEKIYLAHDDTLLGTGKNGFAITESGFYCRRFLDSESDRRHNSYSVLTSYYDIDEEGDTVWAFVDKEKSEGFRLIYDSTSKERKDLVILVRKISYLLTLDWK